MWLYEIVWIHFVQQLEWKIVSISKKYINNKVYLLFEVVFSWDEYNSMGYDHKVLDSLKDAVGSVIVDRNRTPW